MSEKPIGFFDSGIGGLTVVKKFIELKPNENIVYIGDEARMPYGDREPEEIISFSRQIANFLIEQYHIKMLVVACNTATAVALPSLQSELSIPVIGVIESGGRYVTEIESSNIGVIATRATVKADAYAKTIHKYKENRNVYSKPEPEFVPIVESGQSNTQRTFEFVKSQLSQWTKDNQIDTLVLGCTHFPLLLEPIRKAVGPDVRIIDSGTIEAMDARDLIDEKEIANSEKLSFRKYLTTGDLARFEKLATEWLGGELDVSYVDLEEL
ncbi:MAG: glutamate racemase [Lactobacillaceae bacterium]|jgi:glutamate racemase|nr:glutamate racemase [Lactobacillaceae bacterium]